MGSCQSTQNFLHLYQQATQSGTKPRKNSSENADDNCVESLSPLRSSKSKKNYKKVFKQKIQRINPFHLCPMHQRNKDYMYEPTDSDNLLFKIHTNEDDITPEPSNMSESASDDDITPEPSNDIY